MNEPYLFESPLLEGMILRRKSQFTMDVMLEGNSVACHCPTTGRIGDVDVKGLSCLLSFHDDPKRKLRYTVEAVSCDPPDNPDKHWIGINQTLSNRLVEHLLVTRQLPDMIADYSSVRREVTLGSSRLDFLVGSTYLEVKTPLTTLHVPYGAHVKTRPAAPFSSTDRMVKHVGELASSLSSHERAILLTVHQYQVRQPKAHQRSTNYDSVHAAFEAAIAKGLEAWTVDFRFTPQGVWLAGYEDCTTSLL